MKEVEVMADSPLHNREKGHTDIMPRSNRAGRAISVIVIKERRRKKRNSSRKQGIPG